MCVLLDTATYYIKQNHLLSRCILQDIKNILPLLAGTRILCLTVTNAFHKFQESCLSGGILLEDTGVFKHMAEHNTDLIPQNSLGFFTLQAGAVLFDQTIDPVSVYSQRAASFAAGVGGGTGQNIGNGGALIFQAGGQDGQAHYLNQADILFFDVVVFLVRVEDAVRILFGGAVVAQR